MALQRYRDELGFTDMLLRVMFSLKPAVCCLPAERQHLLGCILQASGAQVPPGRLNCHWCRALISKETRHPKFVRLFLLPQVSGKHLSSNTHQLALPKLERSRKYNATLVCFSWSDAGSIPKTYIRFWGWKSGTRSSALASKCFSDFFFPSANLTFSQEVGRQQGTYSPTIKGAPHSGEPS